MQKSNRELILTREKKIIGCIADFYIFIDNRQCATIKNGATVSLTIDSGEHSIYILGDFSTGKMYSEGVKIPANDLDYYYHIVHRASAGTIELQEDYSQSNYNKSVLYERQLEQRRQCDVQRIRKKVNDLLEKEIGGKNRENWNFDMALSELTYEERASDVVKQVLKSCWDAGLKATEDEYAYEELQRILNPFRTMYEYKNEVENILKHENVLCDRQNRIKSIFKEDKSYLETYKSLEEKYLAQFGSYTLPDEIIERYLYRMKQTSQAYANKEYEKGLRLQMLCDTDLEEFNMLKELIVFSAMNPTPSKDDNINTQSIHAAYDNYVSPIVEKLDVGKSEFYPTVDMVIAKTIVLSRANLIDNVAEDLTKVLEVIGGAENRYNLYIQDNSQFEVLRKVFEYYKAPKEEIAVLEAMFTYNIPRTLEQEQRLAFLKKGNSNVPKMYEARRDLNVFTYDYRVLQWSENDIRSYIDGFTMNSKIYDIPMVIDSFEKSVSVSLIKWDDEKIGSVLTGCVKENFGDKYGVCCVETATVTDDFGETVPAILITANESKGKGYQWLGFLVIGDQITFKQMNLSIYSLYMPDKNRNSGSIMQDNEKIVSEVVVAKLKQNPRLNNYIGTVTNILVDTIEKWINNNVSADIYN